jgi:predicted phage-related endonuclease
MPLPDPHADEMTVELDENIFEKWRQAKRNVEGWEREAKRLREMLEKQLGDAYAGLVNDEKVLTYRPTEKWAVERIRTDHPDLTQHFMRTKETEFFDIESFVRMYPDVADRYRVRQFRLVEQ